MDAMSKQQESRYQEASSEVVQDNGVGVLPLD
jgi:hypothetical protein